MADRRLSGPRRLLALIFAALALLAAGCGDDGGDGSAATTSPPTPGGTLTIALPAVARQFDPLLAESRADQLVARQITEPLVASLAGPYGDVRRLPGLARSVSASPDDTIWTLELRQGVRFQDGARFNASAVLENAERWRATAAGRSLLPGVVAVDAPSPDEVRFVLDGPDGSLPDRLSSPRLGVVSPRALQDGSLARVARIGTGAFELRERSPERILVARNVEWWGTQHELGPALSQVEMVAVPESAERYELLRRGAVQVAEALGPPEAARARHQPLLTVLAGPAEASLGLERSVRGIDSASEIPVLSGVWLTRIAGG